MTTLALGGKKVTGAGTGVDNSGLYDDTAIFDEFLNVRAGVGIPDLSLLSGVEPDFALANTGDGCGESLLRTKVDHSGVWVQKEINLSRTWTGSVSHLDLEDCR